jgi:hypothetical protein
MKLMPADIDKSPGCGNRLRSRARRDALVRGADQQQKQECDEPQCQHAADNRSPGRGSRPRFSARPYFSMRE